MDSTPPARTVARAGADLHHRLEDCLQAGSAASVHVHPPDGHGEACVEGCNPSNGWGFAARIAVPQNYVSDGVNLHPASVYQAPMACAASSAALSGLSVPPYAPIGIRTGSQMTTSRMSWVSSRYQWSHESAAGDLEYRARHVGGHRRGQEQGNARDLLRLAGALKGNFCQLRVPHLPRHCLGHG